MGLRTPAAWTPKRAPRGPMAGIVRLYLLSRLSVLSCVNFESRDVVVAENTKAPIQCHSTVGSTH